MVWGGDETIKKIKKIDTKLKVKDLYFRKVFIICNIFIKIFKFKTVQKLN